MTTKFKGFDGRKNRILLNDNETLCRSKACTRVRRGGKVRRVTWSEPVVV